MITNGKFQLTDTVFVIGNGAVQNGWEPVMRAFKTVGGLDSLIVDPAEPFSYLVYQLRALARALEILQSDQQISEERKAVISEMFKERFETLNRIRTLLCRNFIEAEDSGEISLMIPADREFEELMQDPGFSIITTNWDTLLHRKFKDHPILSLHGWVEDPRSLYLPTEVTFDSYRTLDPESAKHLRLGHNQAIDLLSHARRVVLWGISLNMYDAEICVALAESCRPETKENRDKEFVVVNPCTLPAKRLSFLTRKKNIRHFVPDGKRCDKSCCTSAA